MNGVRLRVSHSDAHITLKFAKASPLYDPVTELSTWWISKSEITKLAAGQYDIDPTSFRTPTQTAPALAFWIRWVESTGQGKAGKLGNPKNGPDREARSVNEVETKHTAE
ncbi:fas ligand-like protein [Plakobranchus ocellatus]|uniref:Fas ligand-like protein n=1 Tax=Plakobranchus ocellatus TaxID=259542 RepID=A0AAV3XVZ2_9GAST|nr:fas ligand-like protein [Plakobranchus ocellatus]